jgi:hypothetical protein
MNGIPDLWVGAFMLALVIFGWSPFVGFTVASMHNVDGWSYEGGCYDKWITYRNHDMHIFVSKRPKVRHAYRVAFMADDYDDPFEGHCMTIVYEYDDYGNLHDVLANAEVFAIDLIIGEIVGGVEI